MRRWCVLAGALCGAVACGGGRGSSADTSRPDNGDGNAGTGGGAWAPADAAPDQPLDFEEIELGSSQEVIPLLKVGATELGCTLVAEERDPPAVAYQCEEGTLFLAQVGTRLRYTCQHIGKDECKALFKRIQDKVLESAGGGEQ